MLQQNDNYTITMNGVEYEWDVTSNDPSGRVNQMECEPRQEFTLFGIREEDDTYWWIMEHRWGYYIGHGEDREWEEDGRTIEGPAPTMKEAQWRAMRAYVRYTYMQAEYERQAMEAEEQHYMDEQIWLMQREEQNGDW